jgi:hypothetical protein
MQRNGASPSTVLFTVFVPVQQLHDVPSLKTMSHVRAGLQKPPVQRKGATLAEIPVMHTCEGHNQHESVYGRILHPTAVCKQFVVGKALFANSNQFQSHGRWYPHGVNALTGFGHKRPQYIGTNTHTHTQRISSTTTFDHLVVHT